YADLPRRRAPHADLRRRLSDRAWHIASLRPKPPRPDAERRLKRGPAVRVARIEWEFSVRGRGRSIPESVVRRSPWRPEPGPGATRLGSPPGRDGFLRAKTL